MTDIHARFVPLLDDAEPLATLIGFEPGAGGDRMAITLEEGLSGRLVVRQEGGDAYVYLAEPGVTDLGFARPLFRLAATDAAALVAENFGGADFDAALGRDIEGGGDPDQLESGWGDDRLLGRGGSDTLGGGPGNDRLSGNDQNDVYDFAPGFGDDTLADDGFAFYSGADRIRFAEGLAAADLEVRAEGEDLVLSFAGQPGSIRLERTLTSSRNRVESFEFADGTVLGHGEVAAMAWVPDASDQAFRGSYDGEVLAGGGGNDSLHGRGGSDTLAGGPGADLLSGNDDSDVYDFSPGFGQDTVADDGFAFYSGADRIRFAEGLDLADLRVRAEGADLVLRFEGSEDRIRIPATLTSSRNRIESFEFADGTVLSHQELTALAWVADEEDQRFEGSYSAELLAGGGGNDSLYGRGGADTLEGGTGNDWLAGNDDSDRYEFEAGFGQDTVADNGFAFYSGADRIAFGAGLDPADLRVEATDRDLILSFAGREDRIAIPETLVNSRNRIEAVEFADGTVLAHADLAAMAWMPGDGDRAVWGGYDADAIPGGSGNDTLQGRGDADTLDGGTGNDLLVGGDASDTYVFAPGSGQDTVSDNGFAFYSGADRVLFGAGLDPADLQVRPDGDDLLLSFAGTEDRVRLDRTVSGGRYRIETVEFADGTVLDHAALVAMAAADPGDGVFAGGPEADTHDGGAHRFRNGRRKARGMALPDASRGGPPPGTLRDRRQGAGTAVSTGGRCNSMLRNGRHIRLQGTQVPPGALRQRTRRPGERPLPGPVCGTATQCRNHAAAEFPDRI
ncbi:calcium-binding protein [Mangrovicoccus ximenensis]|uniref:calcium-binding protein n=1 Tax=Mangrovicoccus ximenensis TaxID=1911570 RepID=UPI0013752DDE|nr:calcium-binding protein [Mangrovicoccus ximenensis]